MASDLQLQPDGSWFISLRSDYGKVVDTHVPLSRSSIIQYGTNDGDDALRLGNVTAPLVECNGGLLLGYGFGLWSSAGSGILRSYRVRDYLILL